MSLSELMWIASFLTINTYILISTPTLIYSLNIYTFLENLKKVFIAFLAFIERYSFT